MVMGVGSGLGHFDGDRSLNQYQGGIVHFGILKTAEKNQRLVISPLVANWVGTDSAVLRYVHFTLALV